MAEIIPKKISSLSQKFSILFYVALAFLIFVAALIFILNLLINNSQKTLKELENKLAEAETSQNIALEKEILVRQKKINDFSQVISRHLETTRIFSLIEKNTHPKVWYSQVSLNSEGGAVSLSGVTDSFESLGQQLMILQEEKLIKSLGLEKVAIGREGKIEFGLSVVLDSQVFIPYRLQ